MKRLANLFSLFILAVWLAACGGGPEPAALSFDGEDTFKFTPASATVAAGAEVTVTLNNKGALAHSWTLLAAGVDPTTATDANAIGGATTGEVAAGTSKSITFTAPAAGTYTFVCTVPGHAAGGMVGTLTVQ
ncbi:MAG: plastocyanin/azurin family copper-binding protein [Chloroflexota bacterium]